MKIVLLGASGQLGQEWQKVVSNHSANEYLLLPYTSTEMDITNFHDVSQELHARRPEVVVNCAAYTDVDGAEEHREQAHRVNADAVSALAKLSRELDFKLIHYSTDYIFPGNQKDRLNLPDGYPEDHTADPINWYGQTKWEGEQAIREHSDNHLIIRLSWLCSQFGQNFIKSMLELGRERDRLQVVNDQWGSPTFTRNVVTNSLRLLESNSNGTYHLTSKGMITWYDLAQKIFELKDIDVEVEPVTSEAFPTKAERPHFSKLNTDKIEAVPECEIIDWEEGVRSLLDQLD